RHHIEIRGLGVLNIAELFGVLATTDEMHIDLVLELVDQRSQTAPDRLGIAETRFALLGFDLPHRQVQVRPGRDLATIIEVAARSQLLKQRGFHAARRFAATLDRDLRKRAVR
ncbi:MAG TPA: HPr kinase/phosphorylase, partial [Candidatus Bathyarchaeia archaeon]|nr:HPr kinase/phosphorylase [Candidatus Bathyarchaeia archaeon]